MSEHDRPGGTYDRPDDTEDTRPLWQPEPSYDEQGYDQPGYDAQGYDAHGYDEPTQHLGYGYGPGPGPGPGYGYGYGYPPAPQQGAYVGGGHPQRGRVPGWLWPVVAVIALFVGLLGGAAGGALVAGSVSGVTGPTVFDSERAPAAPLDPENGSIAAVADALLPSTVQILARGGGDGSGEGRGGGASGSGFVVDRQGHVITNNHVVSGATGAGQIEVVDHAGKTHAAEIVGRSPVYDIAVLRIEGGRQLKPAALGSSRSMNVGETVVAIGSPLGLSSTVTSGIVSALDRPVTTGDRDESSFINAVQTDAAINPGNSGGPLVNLRGEVVGVNSAIATMGGFAGDAGNIGVGFAIPMEQVRVTADQILRTGEATYPVIGANVNTGNGGDGAEIVGVPSGTPADEAGLREGDVVVAVDGTVVNDGIELIVAIRSHQPGETITLRVRRGGDEQDLRITLDGKVG